jgi:hypothetical protein
LTASDRFPKLFNVFFIFVGRIRTERLGGAWCPKHAISRDAYEWLEIDLQELKAITQVETQGRFGNGQVSDVLAPISNIFFYNFRYASEFLGCFLAALR